MGKHANHTPIAPIEGPDSPWRRWLELHADPLWYTLTA